MLRLVPGEVQIDRVDMIEDTKGNNGDRGVMRVTNLRLIWYASSMPRINLSIGYNNITGLQSREVISRIRGTEVEALYVMARAPNFSTKFEFIFTAMTSGMHSKLFNTVNSVHRAYETTKLYRELKMRGSIVDERHNLKLLPLEQLIENVSGVWNLSTDQGTLGCFVITNVRLVWFASTNPLYNVSVPYLQLYSCRIRESKFGLALVIETTTQSGEYVLGFRIDPVERLQQVCKAIQALHKAANIRPIFGVTFSKDKPPSPRDSSAETMNVTEEEEGVEQKELRTDAFAAYFSDGDVHSDERRPPVFSEELGLAIEQLKPGFTIADLWNIYID
uniref:Bardet-Biedl syndrome 5 protein homolog n=1 Tax=Angiostrongylus cantonensis TaxID=6313 RepID=A0A158P6E8_ANGCA